MTTEQKFYLVDWFAAILKAFENFFHQLQLWLDGDIKNGTIPDSDETHPWLDNLMATDTGAETTGA